MSKNPKFSSFNQVCLNRKHSFGTFRLALYFFVLLSSCHCDDTFIQFKTDDETNMKIETEFASVGSKENADGKAVLVCIYE